MERLSGAPRVGLAERVWRALARLPDTFLKTDAHDDHARLTIDACRLLEARGDALHVLYLGSSTAHLALHDVDDPAPLERALGAAIGERVRFWNLTADGERVADYLAVAAHVPAGLHAVAVAMLSDTRRDTLERERRAGRGPTPNELLALDLHELAPFGAVLGERPERATGALFLDHLRFFAARRVALVRPGGGPPRERPLAHRRGEHARFDAVARRLDGDAHVRAVMRAHFAEIALLGHVLRARGVPLALLAEPVTPRFDALKPHLKHDYLAGVHALADRIGAPYWDLDAEVGLTTDEFWDPIHIGSDEARERFQTAFVARLAAFVLAERARGAPAADARGPGLDELGEPADDGAE